MKPSSTNGQAIRKIIAGVLGKGICDEQYIVKKVFSRNGKYAGVVTNTSRCTLDGCGGTRLHVKWPDGRRTYPCAKGCDALEDGSLQIR
jgi:hypothetical protein